MPKLLSFRVGSTVLNANVNDGHDTSISTADLNEAFENSVIQHLLQHRQSSNVLLKTDAVEEDPFAALLSIEGIAIYSRKTRNNSNVTNSDVVSVSATALTRYEALEHQSPAVLMCCDDVLSRDWRVVLRCYGGKGGFDKQISKKGRLYEKAKRRGETDQTLRRLARNLQGERVNTVQGERRGTQEGGATPRHLRREQRQETAAEAQARKQLLERQAERVLRREAFGAVVSEAVAAGMAVLLQKQSKDGQSK